MGFDKVKELREYTGVSVMECKKALDDARGDMEVAKKILVKRFGGMASHKAGRETKAGIVDSYIHSNGRVGVLVELFAETDFVARHENFKALAHEIALHVAAMNPLYVSLDQVPQEVAESEKKEIIEEVKKLGKPKELEERIAQGKLETRLSEICLMSQPSVRNPEKKISDVIEEAVGKFGENIKIGRFVRYSI